GPGRRTRPAGARGQRSEPSADGQTAPVPRTTAASYPPPLPGAAPGDVGGAVVQPPSCRACAEASRARPLRGTRTNAHRTYSTGRALSRCAGQPSLSPRVSGSRLPGGLIAPDPDRTPGSGAGEIRSTSGLSGQAWLPTIPPNIETIREPTVTFSSPGQD